MKSRYHLITGLGVLALTAVGVAGTAHAQAQPYYPPPPSYGPPPGYGAPPPPPRGMYRSGFVFGLGLGLGANSASGCGDVCGFAGVWELHLGGMIDPRLAILFEMWGIYHPWSDGFGDSHTTTNSMFAGAAQFWVTDNMWLKGGLGVGHVQVTNDSALEINGDETGFALYGAAGIELVQAYNFALDLQLRIGNGFYSQGGNMQNYGLLVGVNWY
jgi:hypothetical protein